VEGNVLVRLHFRRRSSGPATIKRGCRQAEAAASISSFSANSRVLPPVTRRRRRPTKTTVTRRKEGLLTATVPYFRAAARTTDRGNWKTEHRVENPNLPLPPLTWEFIYFYLLFTMMRIFSFSQLFLTFSLPNNHQYVWLFIYLFIYLF
jgi:hypothetical protein